MEGGNESRFEPIKRNSEVIFWKGAEVEQNKITFWRAIAVLLLTALLTMKLPHLDQSIFQLIVPPIKISEGSRLYLSGLFPLVLLFWCYHEIVKSNYLNRGKITIFILMFFFLVPFLFRSIDVVKVPYYRICGGLKSVDVIKSDYTIDSENTSGSIKVDMTLRNYGRWTQDFKILLVLPENLKKVIGIGTVELPRQYSIDNESKDVHIQETIPFRFKKGYSSDDLFDTDYFYENYKIVLARDGEKLTIIQCQK